MSHRCHHGSPRHGRFGPHDGQRPLTAAESAAVAREPGVAPRPRGEFAAPARPPITVDAATLEPTIIRPQSQDVAPGPQASPEPALTIPPDTAPTRVVAPLAPEGLAPERHRIAEPTPSVMVEPGSSPQPGRNGVPAYAPIPRGGGNAPLEHGGGNGAERGATAPQLRRFIKSRAYVPIHELRRRFVINGEDDDVTAVDLERTRVFVGLPEREGRLIGELLRSGDIGYELSMDPITPIVVGVYPMRPITRN